MPSIEDYERLLRRQEGERREMIEAIYADGIPSEKPSLGQNFCDGEVIVRITSIDFNLKDFYFEDYFTKRVSRVPMYYFRVVRKWRMVKIYE